ncbi:GNAT family N-acetyltransferase [Streptomyces sp. NPDC057552]|uniref:GNAT family N-acetyltransferase n=1 Tax=Streptomyces sp. NPDC057552 TaxID=3350537 RepID=UPI0036A6A69B
MGPDDVRAGDDVFDLRVLAHKTDTPQLPPPCRADFDGSVRVAPPATVTEEWAGYDEELRCVVSIRLEFPVEENLDTCMAPVLVVHPAFRRRGHGRRAVAFARERAAARGRSRLVLVSDSGEAGSSGSDGSGEGGDGSEDGSGGSGTGSSGVGGSGDGGAASAIAAALGAREIMRLTHLRLAVADAPAPWPAPDGLTVRHWGSTVPDDLVHEAARLESTLSQDAPTGDLGWEPQPAHISRIRDFERMRIARGRRAHQCGILDGATGRMVAWTALSMTTANPDNALQAVTVVDPAYRGRDLGRLVKALNLAHCRAAEPGLTHVDSWNAEANVHMRRVNADFGFREAGARHMWETSVR